MKEYKRESPQFSLCGLNCGLCPRYHSDGPSKCPGCGGADFHLKHPSCAVITCSRRHGGVEYCFLCEDYPCGRYKSPAERDSFITYQNVHRDMKRAVQNGIGEYLAELNQKTAFLEYLIGNFNDGRKKSFYCTAVNLLDMEDLNEIKKKIAEESKTASQKDMIRRIESLFLEKAGERGISLALRK